MGLTKEQLVDIREKMGLDQEQFAEFLDFSKSYISKLETGAIEINEKLAAKLYRRIGRRMNKALVSDNLDLVEDAEIDYSNKNLKGVDLAEGGRPLMRQYEQHQIVLLNLLFPVIEDLPDDNYKLFQVEGNSMMNSVNQGDWLLCKKDDFKNIINGRVYVLVITNEAMAEFRQSRTWVKRCYLRKEKNYVTCKSDHIDSIEPYITFQVKADEIAACWYPVRKITVNMSDPNKDIYERLDELDSRIEMLESTNEK